MAAMRPRRVLLPALLTCSLIATACGDDGSGEGDDAAVRINEIQTIGSHNSYHLAMDGPAADTLAGLAPDYWESIDYSHEPVTDQLETYGIRQFEFDVFADPEGGLYSNRPAMEIVGLPTESGIAELDDPGFKTMHTQDVDFETTCVTFVDCLSEVDTWSSANPTHVPIAILVELKSESLAEQVDDLGIDLSQFGVDWVEPLPMTPQLFDDLEGEVLSVFDEDQIITPDDVRGDHDTLDEAISEDGWPTLDDSRGKVIFLLDNPGAEADMYREGAPALENKLLFTSAEPGAPDAAFVKANDPIEEADLIAAALEAGYLVRTRSDTPTGHARTGDTSMRDAALASGAQYVSTDFYREREEFGTGYVVVLSDGVAARCNPVTAPATCIAADLEP